MEPILTALRLDLRPGTPAATAAAAAELVAAVDASAASRDHGDDAPRAAAPQAHRSGGGPAERLAGLPVPLAGEPVPGDAPPLQPLRLAGALAALADGPLLRVASSLAAGATLARPLRDAALRVEREPDEAGAEADVHAGRLRLGLPGLGPLEVRIRVDASSAAAVVLAGSDAALAAARREAQSLLLALAAATDRPARVAVFRDRDGGEEPAPPPSTEAFDAYA